VTRTAADLNWVEGNRIGLLQNGADFFPALCDAIDHARVSVHLETYIFMPDRTGRRVLACLEAAARRGVKVRVVLDGFGSSSTAKAVQARIVAAGGQCRIFRPEPSWLSKMAFSRARLRRLHRKVTVVDGVCAFVGGINIVDDFDDQEPNDEISAPRFDFAVEVYGPLVTDIVYAQDLMWVRLNWARLRRHPGQWREMRLTKPSHHDAAVAGVQRAALLLRDNLRFRQTFEQAYLYGIHHAREQILISNAYFFPGRQFRKALLQAAARGVRVRMLLQGKPEYRMQYYVTRSLYEQLLAGGIEIYEYTPGYLHAKVAVIDRIASVGSSNLDPFSLLLAREANVAVDDPVFAGDLQQRLEQAIVAGGRRVVPQEYLRRGWIRRCVDAMSYVMLRVGVALTGKSGQY